MCFEKKLFEHEIKVGRYGEIWGDMGRCREMYQRLFEHEIKEPPCTAYQVQA